MTILFRNRMGQVMFLLFIVIKGAMVLGPGLNTRPLREAVTLALFNISLCIGVVVVFLFLMGLAMGFLLKQRGVVGEHTLEITEQGLIERTDVNESAFKWDSICRVVSCFGHLYIYVSDMNAFQVPKRCLSPQEADEFETDLRTRIKHRKAAQ